MTCPTGTVETYANISLFVFVDVLPHPFHYPLFHLEVHRRLQ